MISGSRSFLQVQAKSVTDTLLEVECETLETQWPLEALIDAVADTHADVKTRALLNNLADTVAEVEAETLYKTLDYIRAETLIEVLHDTRAKKVVLHHTSAKDKGRNSW